MSSVTAATSAFFFGSRPRSQPGRRTALAGVDLEQFRRHCLVRSGGWSPKWRRCPMRRGAHRYFIFAQPSGRAKSATRSTVDCAPGCSYTFGSFVRCCGNCHTGCVSSNRRATAAAVARSRCVRSAACAAAWSSPHRWFPSSDRAEDALRPGRRTRCRPPSSCTAAGRRPRVAARRAPRPATVFPVPAPALGVRRSARAVTITMSGFLPVMFDW